MELKIFTLPTCKNCHSAKRICQEIARRRNLKFREVTMNTSEGQREGLPHQIMSTPSIVLGDRILSRGRFLSLEKLEEEVSKVMGEN